jgi:thiol-disulfide isomerase/thioredoxin|tara:strand:+ start:60 stop:542 length:483 start_codon:yes stop_codon:yes gene_type:complete
MLDKIKESASQLLTNKKFLGILFFVVILIGVAVYTYQTYISPRLDPSFVPNKEFVSKDDDVKEAVLHCFLVDWCPYSKKAVPIINKLQEKYKTQKINGITLHIKSINCTEDDSALNSFEQEHSVKIEGFPTIYLVKGTQVIEYDAKVEESTLNEYLNSVL